MKTLTRLVICLVAGIGAVVLLYYISAYQNRKKGSFIRLIPPHQLSYYKDIDLKEKSWMFSGESGQFIYLYNKENPMTLLKIDTSLSVVDTVKLFLPERIGLYGADIRVSRSGMVFIFDGAQPAILHTAGNSKRLEAAALGHQFFSRAIPLDNHTMALVRYDTSLRQNIVQKFNFDQRQFVPFAFVPVPKGDGVFSVDGSLSYNADDSSLVFCYFYRNEFVRLDSSLSVLYKARTIDTTTNVPLHLKTIVSEGKTVMTSPAKAVNAECYTSGEQIYILSNTIGANEAFSTYDHCSAIDRYSLKDGSYQSSFYACKFRGEKLRSFRVCGSNFIGLYGNYLAIHKLKQK
jgi:hypothetical protein